MEKRVRSKQRAVGKGRLILVGTLAVLGFFVFSFGGLVLNGYRLNQQADALRRDIKALEVENEKLQGEAAYLEGDQGLEKMAREQLGWVRPGETGVVTIPSVKDDGERSVPTTASKGSEMPNWRRWWDLFFKG